MFTPADRSVLWLARSSIVALLATFPLAESSFASVFEDEDRHFIATSLADRVTVRGERTIVYLQQGADITMGVDVFDRSAVYGTGGSISGGGVHVFDNGVVSVGGNDTQVANPGGIAVRVEDNGTFAIAGRAYLVGGVDDGPVVQASGNARILISGNANVAALDRGIFLSDEAQVLVSGGRFHGAGIHAADTATVKMSGGDFFGGGLYAGDQAHMAISGGTISVRGSTAVQAGDRATVTISDVPLSSTGGSGVNATGHANVTILDASLFSSGGSGVNATGHTNVTILDASFFSPGGSGVDAGDHANVTVLDASFFDSGVDARGEATVALANGSLFNSSVGVRDKATMTVNDTSFLASGVDAVGEASVTISRASFEASQTGINAMENAQVSISHTSFQSGSGIRANGNSTIRLSDVIIDGSGVQARGNSRVLLINFSITTPPEDTPFATSGINTFDFGQVTLVGRSFLVDGLPVDFGLLSAPEGTLSGINANGTSFRFGFSTFRGGPITLQDVFIGDYNGTGTVDQADLDLVLRNWGFSGVPAGWISNLPVGQVGQSELDAVLATWGVTSAVPLATAAVPEPQMDVLAVLILAAATLHCRRRSKSGDCSSN